MTSTATTTPDGRRTAVREWVGMAVVGGVSVVVDFAVFNVLLAAGASPALANLTALVVATLFAFVGNWRWTFSHREIADPKRALLQFFLVNLISAGLVQVVVMAAAVVSLDVAWLNGMKLAATVVATLARFWLYRAWVYRVR